MVRRRTVLRGAVGLLLGSLAATGAAAQSSTTATPGLEVVPAWARAWSPLRPAGEMIRSHPLTFGDEAARLLAPQAPIGMAWLAGNPAALADEVETTGTLATAGGTRRSGSYRRPLDPAEEDEQRLLGVGWTPLGTQAAAAGAVGARWVSLASPVFADVEEPHTGSPYVVMDTTGTDMQALEASVEGALARRFGAWSVGGSLGARTIETRSVATPVPRTWRVTEPGAALGVTREITESLRVGAHGRAKRSVTTINIQALQAPARIYLLEVFTEPEPTNTQSLYFHRIERSEWLAGLAAAGNVGPVAWTTTLEFGRLDEEQYSETSNDPALDVWASDVLAAGVQAAVPLGSVDLRAEVGWRQMTGDGHRSDVEEVAVEADETELHGRVRLRVPVSGSVALLGQVGVRRDDRAREDRLARKRAEIDAWITQVTVGVESAPTDRLRLASSFGFSRYGSSGGLPQPADLGDTVREYVLPELSLMSAPVDVQSVAARVGWALAPDRTLWIGGSAASARGQEGFAPIFAVPTGRRSSWALSVGFEG